MPAPAEDLLHCWLSDRADEIVWATLQKGSQMAKLYNEATRPHLQSILGPLFTPADCYCLPTEAKHQVCTGLLRAHPAFDHLRQMMSETELKELAIGQPLADVLLRLDVYMQEQTASKHVFFLVCSEKASVILACTHAGCPHFHYDSDCFEATHSLEGLTAELSHLSITEALPLRDLAGIWDREVASLLEVKLLSGQNGSTHRWKAVQDAALRSAEMVFADVLSSSWDARDSP
eukprot:s4257_g1.t1